MQYAPLSLADVPRLFDSGQLALDVAMVQVAPPDPDEPCSLGISVDITKAAALAARTVIAEVNPRDAAHRLPPQVGQQAQRGVLGGRPRSCRAP